MKLKKLYFVPIFSILMLTVTSCGSKENTRTSDEKQTMTEQNTHETTNDNSVSSKVSSLKLNDNKLDISETSDITITIIDGNTGEKISVTGTNDSLKSLIQNMNTATFETISTEPYTGWSYRVKISNTTEEIYDILITGDELIQISSGGTKDYYKTDYAFEKLIREFWESYSS